MSASIASDLLSHSSSPVELLSPATATDTVDNATHTTLPLLEGQVTVQTLQTFSQRPYNTANSNKVATATFLLQLSLQIGGYNLI